MTGDEAINRAKAHIESLGETWDVPVSAERELVILGFWCKDSFLTKLDMFIDFRTYLESQIGSGA